MGLIQIALLVVIVVFLYRFLGGQVWRVRDVFSDTRQCSRCEGNGWWQNTRSRERCEWCGGSGRVPKDFPLD